MDFKYCAFANKIQLGSLEFLFESHNPPFIEIKSNTFTIGSLTFKNVEQKLSSYQKNYKPDKKISEFSLLSLLSLFEEYSPQVHCNDGFYGINLKNLPEDFDLCFSQKFANRIDVPTTWRIGGFDFRNQFAPESEVAWKVKGKDIFDFKIIIFLKNLIIKQEKKIKRTCSIMEKKPLKKKAYGSIPHFTESKKDKTDYVLNVNQQNILMQKERDFRDTIIVEEKLDGSNCCVAKINDEIYSLTRKGYLANTSPFEQHHYFEKWVQKNFKRFNELLKNGERIVGEWLMQAHGTRYLLPHEPFVVFDLFDEKNQRLLYLNLLKRTAKFDFVSPKLFHIGQPLPLKKARKMINNESGHGAIDPTEGVVYRCERNNKVEFLGKYVRTEKIDGYFLDDQWDKLTFNVAPELLNI